MMYCFADASAIRNRIALRMDVKSVHNSILHEKEQAMAFSGIKYFLIFFGKTQIRHNYMLSYKVNFYTAPLTETETL